MGQGRGLAWPIGVSDIPRHERLLVKVTKISCQCAEDSPYHPPELPPEISYRTANATKSFLVIVSQI